MSAAIEASSLIDPGEGGGPLFVNGEVPSLDGAVPSREARVVVGPLDVDLVRHRVTVAGYRIKLTAMQLRLLSHLARFEGQVVSRTDLLRDVWGYRNEITTRVVDLQIHRLRSKLGTSATLIGTVRGVGYRLSPAAE